MKRSAPAALRNRAPILHVLQGVLSAECNVLEVGSGTGQHADFFTEQVAGWRWQPTDLEDENLACIAAYRSDSGRANFLPPRRLDVTSDDWPDGPYDAVLSANMIHIAPWAAALGLFTGAERVLGPEGLLVLYGPFRFSGTFTAESNAAFDARLRGEDPAWGVRDLDDIRRETVARGFAAPSVIAMPANNHVLVFARA